MNERIRCPECTQSNTERVHVDWGTDSVIEVRVCNACGAEYENRFARPIQEVTYSPGDNNE